jgi:pentatricopeptide repeat protein
VAGGRVIDALVAFDEMKFFGEHDVLAYWAIMNGCCKSFQVDDALRVLHEMCGRSGVG